MAVKSKNSPVTAQLVAGTTDPTLGQNNTVAPTVATGTFAKGKARKVPKGKPQAPKVEATSEVTPDTIMIDGISVKRLVRHLDSKAKYSLRTVSRMLGIQQNFTNAVAVARAAFEARKEDAMDDFVGAWAEIDPKYTAQVQL